MNETEEITLARIHVCEAAQICQGPFYTIDEVQAKANLVHALRKLNVLLLSAAPKPEKQA